MINKIKKANGSLVDFDVSKLRKWSEFASEGKLNWSEIEMEAVKSGYDGMTTRELHNAMINACTAKKDKKYADMASRLLIGQVYKDAFGGHNNIPTLKDFNHKMVERGLWEDMGYSDEELDTLDKAVNHKKDLKYAYSVIKQMVDKYLIVDNVNKVVHESPQLAFIGIAMKAMQVQPKERRLEDVIRFYNYISDLKINLPSPYLTTMRTRIEGSASCCLFRADDTAKSLSIANHLAHEFTLSNAGIGAYLQTRAAGDGVKSNRIIHGGLIPYFRWMESGVGASKQSSRGGSATITFSVLEPDWDDLIRLKNPTSPAEKRVDKLDYSVVLNTAFLKRAATSNGEWLQVSYKDAPELYEAMYKSEEEFEEVYEKVSRKRIKKKVVNAQKILLDIIKQQFETGRIYILFADNVNKHTPFKDIIYQSNLCKEVMLPTKSFQSLENLYSGENFEEGEVALCFLSSIVAGRVSEEEYEDVAYYTLLCIDNVIETMKYPFKHTEITAKARRSVGVGITNLAHMMASNFATFDSDFGKKIIHKHAEIHYYYLLKGSLRLAKEKGNAEWMHKTKWPDGWLPLDTYAPSVDNISDFKLQYDWEALRKEVIEQGGIRNSVLAAVAPNESSSLASNTTNSVYPIRDLKMFKQSQQGNVLFIAPDADKLGKVYQSAWDIDSKHIADLYSIIGKFTDQGISCDSWVDLGKNKSSEELTRERVMFILRCAKQGVKSLYYLNSRTKQIGTLAEEYGEIAEVDCEGCSM